MGKRHRILIIDDSKEIVAALKDFFERKYETLTAHDGFGGLQIFEQYENGIDLVITDLLMPDLSGFGLISILKKKYPGVQLLQSQVGKGMLKRPRLNFVPTSSLKSPSRFLNSTNQCQNY